ncbi:hypothetical protein RB195_000520 [Necator americanus]|uniref:AP3A hydrolase n=1 Tax=Necator americanus TaxID=51031 RepID=A0ABR1DBJ6_NECAM
MFPKLRTMDVNRIKGGYVQHDVYWMAEPNVLDHDRSFDSMILFSSLSVKHLYFERKLMLYVLLFHLVTLPLISTLSAHPKLIIIAFDGFRYDFMNVTLVPNIYDWALGGAWFVNGVRSQYVSFTATNFMAISTGLYTESHGIVSNKFFDHSNGKLYDIWNFTNTPGIVETSLEPEWYRGEPIWLTNERAFVSRHSASLYWPFGQAPFPGTPAHPSMYRPWERFRSFDEWLSDVDTIVELFTRPKDPVNFLAWYIAEPDHTLHLNGFYNGEYEKMLKKLDKLFLYFIRKMEEFGLNKEVNVIFTADHGHAQIDGYKNIMCVKDYINVKTIIDGQSMIYTFNTDLLEEVYENLTSAVKTNGFKVKIYKKEKFPPRYHYTGMSSRIGEIILEPEIGWDVNFECTREEMTRKYGGQKLHSSTHGMDPNEPEMHATLVLVGPDIPPKQLVRRIPQNIDLYGLMCYLLDIQPSPNNGSMTTFLKNVNFTNKQQSYYHGFLIVVVPLIGVIILILIFALVQCFRKTCRSTRTVEEDVETGDATSASKSPRSSQNENL